MTPTHQPLTMDQLRTRLTCTAPEAARGSRISRGKVYDLIDDGTINGVRVGHKWLIGVPSLLRLMGDEPADQPTPDAG